MRTSCVRSPAFCRPDRSPAAYLARRSRPFPSSKAAGAGQGQLSLFSPSKINLFLRILRKRDDGYHDLASLFQVIDFGDQLNFRLLPEGAADQLSCTHPEVPTDRSNLVIKAFDLFRRYTGLEVAFSTHIEKQVPAGGGLGGGSGNAATALWAANELTGQPASNADLLAWSGEIGSDISIFFSDGAAYCTGRGEIVEPIASPLPADSRMLLVKPSMGLSTPEIFKALDLSLTSQADPRHLLQSMRCSGMQQDLCINDLERPAFSRLPELLHLKDRLAADGSFSSVFMSGSGSTIVCFGSSQAPSFLSEPQYQDILVSPAQLLARQPEGWYEPHAAMH